MQEETRRLSRLSESVAEQFIINLQCTLQKQTFTTARKAKYLVLRTRAYIMYHIERRNVSMGATGSGPEQRAAYEWSSAIHKHTTTQIVAKHMERQNTFTVQRHGWAVLMILLSLFPYFPFWIIKVFERGLIIVGPSFLYIIVAQMFRQIAFI